MQQEYAFSERRACRVMTMAVTTYRYRSLRTDEPLRTKLVELAREKPRFGYRRLQVLLQRSGEHVNHKRLHRVYREAGFPNMHDSSKPMKDLRRSWAKAVKDAGLQHFWLYDLRHTMASRLAQSGVSPIFMEQIIGHANARILKIYARANAEHRRDAIHKLADLRTDQARRQEAPGKVANISSEGQKL